jgi:hypothetical protein
MKSILDELIDISEESKAVRQKDLDSGEELVGDGFRSLFTQKDSK